MNIGLEKFLIVDANMINKQKYRMTREASFNDFDNVYYDAEQITSDELFELYGIPVEYRKVVFIMNNPILQRHIHEYVTGYPFDIKKVKGSAYRINNSPVYYDNNVFKDKLSFYSDFNWVSFEEVCKFFIELSEGGYLANYFASIKKILDISFNDDELMANWGTTEISSKPKVKKYMHIPPMRADL